MRDLKELRREIDEIDSRLVPLMEKRLAIVDEVAEAKRVMGKVVTDPKREREILTSISERVDSSFARAINLVYSTLFGVSKARQRLRLGQVSEFRHEIAVVGLGLIGGSFYKSSICAGCKVTGVHHRDAAGFENADIIIVCLPPEAIVPWIREHAPRFRKGAVVVDICGVKRKVMREMSEVRRDGWHFVGGHPMAGREVSGYENSTDDLFVGASMILTPLEGTPDSAIALLKAYFALVGFSETVVTTCERHDDMIAFTSQLCHVIATTYARDARVKDVIGFSAGSFANMTRIATQDAAVWRTLYSENRDRLVETMDGFQRRFAELRDAIAVGDSAAIERMIVEGSEAKREELLARNRGDE